MLTRAQKKNLNDWIADLESGQFKQTREQLHNPKTGGFCCLGVAANRWFKTDWQNYHKNYNASPHLTGGDIRYDSWVAKTGLKIGVQDDLVYMNDVYKKRFPTIAKRIREIMDNPIYHVKEK